MGYKRRTDYTGQKIGMLLILEKTNKTKRIGKENMPIYIGQCECGIIKEVNHNTLKKGNKIGLSCGCKHQKYYKRGENKKPEFSQIFCRYQIEAKLRNLTFSIPKELFVEMLQQNCYYCEKIPQPAGLYFGKRIFYNGIDRVDNDIGYELDNIVTCCKTCNIKKKATSKSMIIKAYDFLKKTGKI